MTRHAIAGVQFQVQRGTEEKLCEQSHYATVAEALKDVEIYHLGAVDCRSCLKLMVEKHEAVAAVFRARLNMLTIGPARCRVYDAECINSRYCTERDACCAGDPDCKPSSGSEGKGS